MTWAGLAAVVALGAFHGLNPGMGWLFAVAAGLRGGGQRALLRSLGYIAAGHAASILSVAGLVVALRSVLAGQTVAIAGGVGVAGFGLVRAVARGHRHERLPASVRLTPGALTGWSFVMSTVHGAGLMLLPVLVADSALASAGHTHALPTTGGLLWQGFMAVTAHTLATAAVAGAIALTVFRVAGTAVLRRNWAGLDHAWTVALIGSGIAVVALAA
jgi:hypothetical protein